MGGVIDEFLHGLGEGLDVFGGDEVAVFTVDDSFTAAGGVGGDDGPAHGEGFEGGARGAFSLRGEDIDVAVGNGRAHVGLVAVVVDDALTDPVLEFGGTDGIGVGVDVAN